MSFNNDGVRISSTFISNSAARGALFIFVYINQMDESIDFTRSHSLALNRSDLSGGLMLPLALWPGRYDVFVYDIENTMRLGNVIGYQASDNTVEVNGCT